MENRKTFDEWHAERLAADPDFDRTTDAMLRLRGPRRKIDFLVDENIAALRSELASLKQFRLHNMPEGADDHALWTEARRRLWILLTADGDFWNERFYPLWQSPGVIIVVGRTLEDQVFALARLSVVWDLVRMVGRVGPRFMDGMKARTSRTTIEWKFFDNGTTVTHRQ
jgi:hypothetical protein